MLPKNLIGITALVAHFIADISYADKAERPLIL